MLRSRPVSRRPKSPRRAPDGVKTLGASWRAFTALRWSPKASSPSAHSLAQWRLGVADGLAEARASAAGGRSGLVRAVRAVPASVGVLMTDADRREGSLGLRRPRRRLP